MVIQLHIFGIEFSRHLPGSETGSGGPIGPWAGDRLVINMSKCQNHMSFYCLKILGKYRENGGNIVENHLQMMGIRIYPSHSGIIPVIQFWLPH